MGRSGSRGQINNLMKYVKLFDTLDESINGATPINELTETLSQYKELLDIGLFTKGVYNETVREIIVSELIEGLDIEQIINFEKLGLVVLDPDLYNRIADSIFTKPLKSTNFFDASVDVQSIATYDDDISQEWVDESIATIENAAEELGDWVSPDQIRVVIGRFDQTGEDPEYDDWKITATIIFSNGAILTYEYKYIIDTIVKPSVAVLKMGDESIQISIQWTPYTLTRIEYWTGPFYEAVKHLTPSKLIR